MKVVHIASPSTSSKDASQQTIRRRTKILQGVRDEVSKHTPTSQLQHEAQGKILKDIFLTVEELLDLKTMTGLSMTKLRTVKRWLLERKISSGYLGGLQKLQDAIVDDNLKGEWVMLQSWQEDKVMELTRKPLVSIVNLQRKIFQLLDQYDELGELTWHCNRIPEDEVWIKIGGDKGGDTFKLMLQIANVSTPNSLRNTILVSLFPAQDNSFNLWVGLQDIRHQIDTLQAATWRNKRIRVFAFGDYEYLTKAYGLSGPSGKHPCLYCKSTKAETSKSGEREKRDLTTMAQSLALFHLRPVAKEAYNVIREPLFSIPVDQVCPPGLHLSLGIFLKQYKCLENACHTLDTKAAALLASTGSDANHHKAAFQQAVQKEKIKTQITELEEEKKDLLEQHFYMRLMFDESQPADLLIEETKEKEEQIKKLKRAADKLPSLEQGRGPIAQSLDGTLQKIGVRRQAYHGKSFVGNHVHKCLKEHNIDRLLGAMVDATTEVCQELVQEAEELAAKHRTLFSLYGQCHRIFNRGDFLDERDIDELGALIESYMEHLRREFPRESITPKLHIMEDHIIPWLRQWGAGLGLMGEQGGEGLHAHLNNIRSDLRGFNDDLQLHLRSVKAQWAYSNPLAYHQNKK